MSDYIDFTCTDVIGSEIFVEPPSLLMISCEDGTELRLDYSGNELKVSGDADMNEAAKVFFNECLKGHVDEYMLTKEKE